MKKEIVQVATVLTVLNIVATYLFPEALLFMVLPALYLGMMAGGNVHAPNAFVVITSFSAMAFFFWYSVAYAVNEAIKRFKENKKI